MIATEQYAELKIAEGGAWTAREMIGMGWAADDLVRRRRQFQLVYWKDRYGGVHYPKWQFERTMKVLPDVVSVLSILRTHDTMGVLSWFVGPVTPRCESLIDLIRSGRGKRAVTLVREEERRNASIPPLSTKTSAKLRHRVKDLAKSTRYAIASYATRRHAFFFDVGSDYYVLDQLSDTCLFRRREHAEAVVKRLNAGEPNDSAGRNVVIAVSRNPKGMRLLEGIPDLLNPRKKHRPSLRAADSNTLPLLVPIAPPHTRGHIVESFLFATDHCDTVSSLIANSRSRAAARRTLMRQCLLSPMQANAVLDLRLSQFNTSSRRQHEKELRAALRTPPFRGTPAAKSSVGGLQITGRGTRKIKTMHQLADWAEQQVSRAETKEILANPAAVNAVKEHKAGKTVLGKIRDLRTRQKSLPKSETAKSLIRARHPRAEKR